MLKNLLICDSCAFEVEVLAIVIIDLVVKHSSLLIFVKQPRPDQQQDRWELTEN